MGENLAVPEIMLQQLKGTTTEASATYISELLGAFVHKRGEALIVQIETAAAQETPEIYKRVQGHEWTGEWVKGDVLFSIHPLPGLSLRDCGISRLHFRLPFGGLRQRWDPLRSQRSRSPRAAEEQRVPVLALLQAGGDPKSDGRAVRTGER